MGANLLPLRGTVFVSAAYPRTGELVRRLGRAVVALDVSELHKAEAGLNAAGLHW